MEKKIYIRPLMKVVKIKAYRILQGSPTDDVRRYEEKSENESY
jgi:hypothetical protein